MGSWNSPDNTDLHTHTHTLCVLVLGLRRTGKSSCGNTLLGTECPFDIKGGNASTRASAFTAGRHVTVVDAQGWGSSEDLEPLEPRVPRQEKVELLRALSLCGPQGPHVILLVVPLLDFTESDRSALETRLELFTSSVWRHVMVVFTFGDLLEKRGRSVKEHIQSGGPALHWLMDMCCYRYHVLDNTQHAIKAGSRGEQKKKGQSVQVRELVSKMEDMLEENGGWHYSLHMYQRLEEEWSRRALRLTATLHAQLRRAVTQEEEEEEEGRVKGDEEENERKEMEDETMEVENNENVKLKACVHNGNQRLSFRPIRGLA